MYIHAWNARLDAHEVEDQLFIPAIYHLAISVGRQKVRREVHDVRLFDVLCKICALTGPQHEWRFSQQHRLHVHMFAHCLHITSIRASVCHSVTVFGRQ